jgi:aconitase B
MDVQQDAAGSTVAGFSQGMDHARALHSQRPGEQGEVKLSGGKVNSSRRSARNSILWRNRQASSMYANIVGIGIVAAMDAARSACFVKRPSPQPISTRV